MGMIFEIRNIYVDRDTGELLGYALCSNETDKICVVTEDKLKALDLDVYNDRHAVKFIKEAIQIDDMILDAEYIICFCEAYKEKPYEIVENGYCIIKGHQIKSKQILYIDRQEELMKFLRGDI